MKKKPSLWGTIDLVFFSEAKDFIRENKIYLAIYIPSLIAGNIFAYFVSGKYDNMIMGLGFIVGMLIYLNIFFYYGAIRKIAEKIKRQKR